MPIFFCFSPRLNSIIFYRFVRCEKCGNEKAAFQYKRAALQKLLKWAKYPILNELVVLIFARRLQNLI